MPDWDAAPAQFTVTVTQHFIDVGQQSMCRQCPMALAVRNATGQEDVVTDLIVTYVNGVRYRTPPEAKAFMDIFDHYRRMARPGTFTFVKMIDRS